MISGSTHVVEKVIRPDELKTHTREAIINQIYPITVYARQSVDRGFIDLHYLCRDANFQQLEHWICTYNVSDRLVSLVPLCPHLDLHERELMDLHGLTFDHHLNPIPALLLPGVDRQRLPMFSGLPEAKTQDASMVSAPAILDHPQLQQFPYGPVCADVRESLRYDYYLAGETLAHTHQQLSYKHRGIEKKFHGLSMWHGVVLAERVSGIGSVSHGLAYCQAVEQACECHIPVYAQWARVVLSELERLYNHFHYLGHLCHATTLKVASAEASLLSEKIKQLNVCVSGDRLLRNILCPGGVRKPLQLSGIDQQLVALKTSSKVYIDRVLSSQSHEDRLLDTGVIGHDEALTHGMSGPAARASCVSYDLRSDMPYAAYGESQVDLCLPKNATGRGDALARQQVRMHDIMVSFELLFEALGHMYQTQETQVTCHNDSQSLGIGWSESPRGANYYCVSLLPGGLVDHVKITSASFTNMWGFRQTVSGISAMMDFIINEASFGLSIAGCDR